MGKKFSPQTLGSLEKEVMDIVWTSEKPVTVRFVFESLSKKRKIAYTTILTIMGRLAKKDILKAKLQGKSYSYQSTLSKERFLTKVSKQIIKNFVSSFGDAAIANFTEELEKLSAPKQQKLIKLLQDER